MRETDREKTLVLALFLLVFAGIAILSGGFSSLQFRPGKPVPHGASLAPPEVGNTGGHRPTWLAAAFQRILYAILFLAATVTAVGALVSSQFRRFLLRQLPSILILLLIITVFLAFFHPKRAEVSPPSPPTTAAPPMEGTSPEYVPPTVTPPNWSVVLIALGAAAGIVAIGFAAWRRFRSTPETAGRDVLSELGEEAGAAAARIRHGEEPRDVVIRAYREMCDILSRQVENPDYLTPREFARRLRARGMRDEHVDRLTGIFEEVRYGHREGTRFAAAALSCLEEIRDAYA